MEIFYENVWGNFIVIRKKMSLNMFLSVIVLCSRISFISVAM